MPGPQFNEPIEEQYTEWFNPLDVDQVVDIREGDAQRPTRFRVEAGRSKAIPSRYDNVVHRVHNGVIIGGQAPQLVKRGSDEKLDPALNTDIVSRRNADQEASQAVLAQKAASDVAQAAGARAADADDALRARQAKIEAADKKKA